MKVLKGLNKHIFLLILLSIILSYLSLQVALYVSYAIDGILFHNSVSLPNYIKSILEMNKIEALSVIIAIIIGINIIIAIATYLRERVTTKFTLKVASNLREKLYSHILNLEYESYQSYSKVEMLQRVNDDASEYSNFFKVELNLILDIIFLTFFIINQGATLSLSVTIYLCITIIIMIAFMFWYYIKMTKVLENVIDKKRKMLGATISNIEQFKFIRIYNRQNEEIRKYKKLNEDYSKEDIKFVKIILFFEIVSEHITYLSDPIICLLGGISIIQGTMTLGNLTALLLFANKILNCLYTFGENWEIINTFLVVRNKINKLMELKEEKTGGECYDLNGDITFHNVSIKVSKKEILKNLNFSIKKGEKIALLGENGSGKSILAKAMLGLYKIEGNLYFNYHNIKNLAKLNIRKYVDYVFGEADLFTGTIEENIKLDAKVTKEQLENVAKQAEIYEDIKNFEKGYNTVVGEKGVKLSGGQKQRVLIARALLKNKPIMIFDNAFSKLDNKTSNKILENLSKNYTTTTMIFITHKLYIEEFIDRIIRI